MSGSENAFDHNAVFTAPRRTSPGLFREDRAMAARGTVYIASRDGETTGAASLAQDDESAAEAEVDDAPEIVPEPRQEDVLPPAGFVGRLAEPIRAWVFEGKSPFASRAAIAPREVAPTVALYDREAEREAAAWRGEQKVSVRSSIFARAQERPVLAGGGLAVAVVALVVVAGAMRSDGSSMEEAAPPAQQTAHIQLPPALQPVPNGPVQENVTKTLEDIDRRLKVVEGVSQTVNGRIANVEALTASVRSQMEASASPQAEIESLRQGLDEVRGVTASLAEHMDDRLTKFGFVSTMPAPARTEAHVKRASSAKSRKNAPHSSLDELASPATSRVAGKTARSSVGGFVLATPEKLDVAPGDILPGYGRVESVRPAEGGKMLITEGGTIFVRNGKKK